LLEAVTVCLAWTRVQLSKGKRGRPLTHLGFCHRIPIGCNKRIEFRCSSPEHFTPIPLLIG
jgi:hypothetical protein